MTNIRNLKCSRLSKRQMGRISGGKMYKCSITKSNGDNYYMYYNFDSPQALLNWYASLPWGTTADCTPFQTWEDGLGADPTIDMPVWP